MSTPALNPLVTKIRGLHPGTYDDMDDATLTKRVLAKYPQYSDLAAPPVQRPQVNMQQIPDPLGLSRLAGSSQPASPTEAGTTGFENYQAPQISQLLAGAAKSVPGLTGGLTGFEQGEGGLNPQEMKAGMQQATTPQNETQKAGQLIGTTAQMLPWGALGATKAASEAIPAAQQLPFLGKFVAPGQRMAQAGEQFQQVMGAAKDVPVSLDQTQAGALKLMDWQRKTQLGPTINKFLNRITSSKQGPLTYGEARDWYQALGNLSADENSKLLPAARRDLVDMVTGLKQDVGSAAGQVGQAPNYFEAMKQFATGKQGEKALQSTGQFLLQQAKDKLPWLALGYGAKKAYEGGK